MNLSNFINKNQLKIINYNASHGEERSYFKTMIINLNNRIQTMPKTYETDGQGNNTIVYLHYFNSNSDWYILEKDQENEQHQAFGLADLGLGFPELGYISIKELIDNNIELDLYWTPITLGEIKAKHKIA